MAAATVDAGYLAASYAVPETTLQSLLSQPTVELVQSLLTQIEAKARAYDDLQSEKVRIDVELEAAVQGGEQRARTLKATAEKAQKEAEELKKKLVQEGRDDIDTISPMCADTTTENARQAAETALHNLQASATSSTSETQALESRIKTLESHNRLRWRRRTSRWRVLRPMSSSARPTCSRRLSSCATTTTGTPPS
jgi:nucleoprotein TPR